VSVGQGSCVEQAFSCREHTSGRIEIRYQGRSRKLNLECWSSVLESGRVGVRSIATPVTPFPEHEKSSSKRGIRSS